jgi:glutathionylspermidine synthase
MVHDSVEVLALGADPLRDSSLVRELAERFLLWDVHVGGRRRVEACPLVLTHEMHEAAVTAAEGVVRAVGRVARGAHEDAHERHLYGFDADTLLLAAASYGSGDDASLMRVDLLLDEHGQWRACEINADCPGGHNEALGLPRVARAAGFGAGHDPTRVVEKLVARLCELADGGAVGVIHATGYAEDLQVCALVARALERRGTHAILAPPTAPGTRGGDLYIHGEQVRALYRYFPVEWMTGQRNVDAIARAIESGKVRTLTGFSHVFTQSKLAFARSWERLDEGDVARRWLPETRAVGDVTRASLVEHRAEWVVKRAMGRVGDEVFVGQLSQDERAWERLVDGVLTLAREGEAWVAQRFVPQMPIPTPWGQRLVTLGAYVLDGQFAGYFARITPESHVSHDALCVPVFTRTVW